MAFPTTYAGWVQIIKDWIDVDELSDSKIQVCLDLGHTTLNSDLNSQLMESQAPITVVTAGVPLDLLAHVPDYSRIRVLSSGQNGQPLLGLPFNEYQKRVGNSYVDGAPYWGEPDHPWFYSIEAMQLYVWPPAAATSALELSYYKIVTPLGAGVESNEFTDHHPDLLLYAACLEVSRFIVEDERIPVWQQAYEAGVLRANEEAKAAKMGSTPLRRMVNLYQTRGTYPGVWG